ncbi:hypothetical protein CHS0354_018500 [Potamilus streckersoni]|uniref:Cell division protein FtsQ n=1 Tax=Potamilus streckersoni TaxID=2493646 RepID=A0AAE0TAP8_9BIVA|nr:hypothetical protein CHS0354_018500 [Potamilus streckersoni]
MRDFSKLTPKNRSRAVENIKRVVEATQVSVFFRSLIFLVSAGLILIIAGNLIFAVSRPLKPENIVISGNRIVSDETVMSVIPTDGVSIYASDTYTMLINTRKIPWIERAYFKILYPAHLQVHIEERVPVAFYRIPGKIYMLDKDLTVLPPLPNPEGWDLPVIVDFTVRGTIRPGEIIRYPALSASVSLVESVKHSYFFREEMISEIDISDMFDIKIRTFGKNILIHMGVQDFDNKLKNLYYLIPELEKLENIRAIDLRYKNKVIVK